MNKLEREVTRLVQKWASGFGFGHYQILLDSAPDDDKFAHVRYSIEEEWLCLVMCPALRRLTSEQREHVILHELAHVLIALAASCDVGEEIACNRVASLLVGSEHGVRSLMYQIEFESDDDGKVVGKVAAGIKRFSDSERESMLQLMPYMLLRLPPLLRDTVIAIDFDFRDVRDVAREQGVEPSTVMRRRDTAYQKLREMAV